MSEMTIVELPMEIELHGDVGAIYPSLIIMKEELTLVDTGYPGFLSRIEEAIEKNGYTMSQLRNIVITHYDIDHIGSLYDLKEKYPQVAVIASAKESGSISGETKSERLLQAELRLEQMSPEEKGFGLWFIDQLHKLKHVPVDMEVRDGDLILDGMCRVIATPGHTSGHISLYFPSIESVITGDAAVYEHGELVIANPHFCLDLALAEQSLCTLTDLAAITYYCYHGGTYKKM